MGLPQRFWNDAGKFVGGLPVVRDWMALRGLRNEAWQAASPEGRRVIEQTPTVPFTGVPGTAGIQNRWGFPGGRVQDWVGVQQPTRADALVPGGAVLQHELAHAQAERFRPGWAGEFTQQLAQNAPSDAFKIFYNHKPTEWYAELAQEPGLIDAWGMQNWYPQMKWGFR